MRYIWNKGLLWTDILQRLISTTAQDSGDSIPLTTYNPTLKYALGFFCTTLIALSFFVSHDSQAEEYTTPVSTTSSQQIKLLKPRFGINLPQAVGGADAPQIEGDMMHPSVGPSPAVSSSVEQDEHGISYYIVQKGDTVSEIATLFNVSENTIKWENRVGDDIQPGDELRILPVSGVSHKIAKGDTISTIAQKYEVRTEDVAFFNGIEESDLIAGELLIIPNGVKPQRVQRSKSSRSNSRVARYDSSISSSYYIRPTTGPTTSGFGPRNLMSHTYHYGIDIAPSTGTPIVAAASGVVSATYCGSGYGRCLTIEHDNGTKTLYAHTSVIYVSTGTRVQQGQKIAAVGSSGNVTGPHLHFEIIKPNGQKLDPASYIR